MKTSPDILQVSKAVAIIRIRNRPRSHNQTKVGRYATATKKLITINGKLSALNIGGKYNTWFPKLPIRKGLFRKEVQLEDWKQNGKYHKNHDTAYT
jgi:hypothetical protein